jgi:hypothetical protein
VYGGGGGGVGAATAFALDFGDFLGEDAGFATKLSELGGATKLLLRGFVLGLWLLVVVLLLLLLLLLLGDAGLGDAYCGCDLDDRFCFCCCCCASTCSGGFLAALSWVGVPSSPKKSSAKGAMSSLDPPHPMMDYGGLLLHYCYGSKEWMTRSGNSRLFRWKQIISKEWIDQKGALFSGSVVTAKTTSNCERINRLYFTCWVPSNSERRSQRRCSPLGQHSMRFQYCNEISIGSEVGSTIGSLRRCAGKGVHCHRMP